MLDEQRSASRRPASSWRKSSYSGGSNGNCLEVDDARTTTVPVRDSKIPDGARLTFPAAAWSAFVNEVRVRV
ncbi:DUF397 domain-containing protein [Streptomyces xiaopingdaonensis]|uniref:DUF397 domain-containing protein n=1 Tax=Streptomyces xiaopingdaonensis TaxID=1565415 RepID=UPI0006813BDF|nr:DUF397 domain-containing protein [Streptomyces xiaopingdaonensis]